MQHAVLAMEIAMKMSSKSEGMQANVNDVSVAAMMTKIVDGHDNHLQL